ncbi:PrgI family protein [Candidatus Saccharibacteria bacterium]|nr:MAG: PrgI family protein [Candidatus Saccharibacteria bacterium]
MATYKVLQDIEAEDKLVGPLSLRQFVYAGIAAICGYLTFLSFTKHVPFLSVLFVPPMLFCAFFAIPWGKDQSTEIWALAKLRFMLKPRRRIWDQSGAKELVTINVPKHIERHLTNGLNQYEVRSRLRALADTIDSRGWAVKNVNVNMYSQPSTLALETSDRLVEASALPQEVAAVDIRPSDDILDENANPVAHHFEDMITASASAHRQEIMAQMQAPTPAPAQTQQTTAPNDYWFMHQPASAPAGQAMFGATPVITPGSTDEDVPTVPHAAEPTAAEEAMVEKFREENNSLSAVTQGHMKIIKTPEQLQAEAAARATVEAALAQQKQQATRQNEAVTPMGQSDIMKLNLARNNDLTVATLARQMRQPEPTAVRDNAGDGSDEVVVSLR